MQRTKKFVLFKVTHTDERKVSKSFRTHCPRLFGTTVHNFPDSVSKSPGICITITRDASRGIYLRPTTKKLSGEVLALYLEQKGTRNLVVVECPATDVFSASTLDNMQSSESSYSIATKDQVIWMGKYFAPDKVTKKSGKVSRQVKGGGPNTGIQPMTTVNVISQQQEYIDSYSYGGGQATDEMILNEKTNEPSDPGENVIGNLSVSEFIWTPANSSPEVDYVTYWQCQGMGITLHTTKQSTIAEEVAWASTSGSLSNGGNGLAITVGWDPQASYYGFTAGLSFTYQKQVTIGDGNDSTNDGPAGGEWAPSGDYMWNVNQYWATNFDIINTGSEPGTQNLNTLDYVYTMNNTWNNDVTGQQNDEYQFDVNL